MHCLTHNAPLAPGNEVTEIPLLHFREGEEGLAARLLDHILDAASFSRKTNLAASIPP